MTSIKRLISRTPKEAPPWVRVEVDRLTRRGRRDMLLWTGTVPSGESLDLRPLRLAPPYRVTVLHPSGRIIQRYVVKDGTVRP